MPLPRRAHHPAVTALPRWTATMRPLPDRPDVLLYVLDAGGGHRATARALVAAAEQTGLPLRFAVTNLTEVLSPADFTRALTGVSLEETYNGMVREGRTRFLVPLLRSLQWGLRCLERPLSRLVATHLAATRPAVVVSLIPNFNALIRRGVRQALPGTPFAIALTDFADFPPHFWLEPDVDLVIAPTDEAREQARAMGLAPQDIRRTSGLALHPRFYTRPREAAREEGRVLLRVPLETFVVLVVFGAKGSPEMRPITERLLLADPAWHVVAVAGDNAALTGSLRELEGGAGGRLHALGFTDRMPELLAASDLLLSKPGPGTLAEAFHMQVPTVVTCNGHTIPQERANARRLESQGLGVVVRTWHEMPEAAAAIAREGTRHAAMVSRLAALSPNRGVYDVLGVIDELVRHAAGAGR